MKAPRHAQHHKQATHAVGKAATAAKPGGGGTSATGGKGTPTAKHHAPAHHKHQPKKARKWSPDEDVALCSLRAVATAASLTLSDAELLDVYWSAAADADSGMSILAAVAALGWPRLHMPVLGVDKPEPHAVALDPSGLWWSWGALYEPWTTEIDEAWELTWRP